MEPNYSKIFNEKIKQSVSTYCSENNIEDIDSFIQKCFKQGFDIKKYGLLGETLNEGEKDLKTGGVEEKHLIKEVIVEKLVEVPIEVIKEVEKVVTKIEYISDKSSENELTEKIFHLNEELEKERQKFSTKTEEIENFFQNEMSKKDKELDEVRRSLDVKLDETNEKMLQDTLQKLRKELTEKNEIIKELTKINQDLQNTRQNKLNTVFLKGSNIKDTI